MQVGKTGLAILVVLILVTGSISAYNFYTISQINQRIDDLNVKITAMLYGEILKDPYGRTILVIDKDVEVPNLPGVTIVRVPAQRIVSIGPSITETLFLLGKGDQVVAVTQWCNWPRQVVDRKEQGNITVLNNLVDPEVERIVATNPDLVLVTTMMRPEGIESLEALGLPVVAVEYGDKLEDIYDAITLIGKVSGAKYNAEDLLDEMRQNITRVYNTVANLPKPKVFWMIWHDPLMSAGGPSFITALIQTAGGVNIFGSVNIAWPYVSSEEVLAQNPDVIIIDNSTAANSGILDVNGLLNFFPAWSEIKAVKDGKLFIVPDFMIRPGPRTAEAIEIIAELIHGIEI